jgi:hypothetical protein
VANTTPTPQDQPGLVPGLHNPPLSRRKTGWREIQWRSLSTFGVELAVVAVVVTVVLSQLHIGLLLSSTTPTGGDNAGHYVTPYFLGHNLLPHGHLTGWYPGWFAGLPLYTFYFLLPDAFTALASHVITYNQAFKLATVLGSILLPLCVLIAGKLCRLKPPIPAAMAAFTLPFLFDYTYTIYGGNLFSTLAGEYAYSLGLALAITTIGLFARVLHTGKGRAITAVLLFGCTISHAVPALYAFGGIVILTLLEVVPTPRFVRSQTGGQRPRSRRAQLIDSAIVVSTAGLLTGFWLVPAFADRAYTNPMNYLPVTTYRALLLPKADWWVLGLAAAGAVYSLYRWSKPAIMLTALAALSATAVCFNPVPALYNPRFVPLWFISVYLLAGWLVGTLTSNLAGSWTRRKQAKLPAPLPRKLRRQSWPKGALVPLAVALAVVIPPFVLSSQQLSAVGISTGANQVSDWAQWNYSGTQAKPGAEEFNALVATMARLGQRQGCGAATWEYSPDLNRFGSTMALMQLPHWTNGCIGSTEGLLFESSATTPYHFLNQAELSTTPSKAQPGLNYVSAPNVAAGASHLALLGVRYFMASSPSVQAAADNVAALKMVAQSGPWLNTQHSADEPARTTWKIYEVAKSQPVVALTNLPVVVSGVTPDQSSWLPMSEAWYNDKASQTVFLAASGPQNWPRTSTPKNPPVVPQGHTDVSGVKVVTATPRAPTISFHVTRTGIPVLIKVSYFPNWQVSGAKGPWRVTPNLMVVVPTGHNVELTYGPTPSDRLGDLASIAGLLAVCLLALVSYRRWVTARSTWQG